MRIAIPLANGRLCAHFGHCEAFAFAETDAEGKNIVKIEEVTAPDHQPGLLPRWLADKGIQVVLAGGMGSRAMNLFGEAGIRVVVGVPSDEPRPIVSAYLAGSLKTGDNLCDH